MDVAGDHRLEGGASLPCIHEAAAVLQPIFYLRDGEIAGFEISPCGESGRGTPYSEWLCRTLRDVGSAFWETGGSSSLGASVTLPLRTEMFTDLVRELVAAIAQADVQPLTVTLVIAESLLVEMLDSPVLRRGLKAQGVRLAVDDFGTSGAAPEYLESCAVDIVRIDTTRLLTAKDAAGSGTSRLARVVDRVRSFGKLIVLTGVDSADLLADARDSGCDMGQGRWLGPPMGLGELRPFLMRRARPVSPTARQIEMLAEMLELARTG